MVLGRLEMMGMRIGNIKSMGSGSGNACHYHGHVHDGVLQ